MSKIVGINVWEMIWKDIDIVTPEINGYLYYCVAFFFFNEERYSRKISAF